MRGEEGGRWLPFASRTTTCLSTFHPHIALHRDALPILPPLLPIFCREQSRWPSSTISQAISPLLSVSNSNILAQNDIPRKTGYTISLLVAIPLGFVFKAVTSDPYKCKTDAAKAAAVANRHSLAGIIGVLFMVFVFGWDIGHALFSGTVSFVLMHIVPTKTVHIWVTVWAMGYMSCSHIYRQIVAYGMQSHPLPPLSSSPHLLLFRSAIHRTSSFSSFAGALPAKDPRQQISTLETSNLKPQTSNLKP